MNQNHNPESLNLHELALACASQETLYRGAGEEASDPRFCYELFRRAVVHKDQAAWSLIYQQYEAQVAHWIRQNPVFRPAEQRAEDFVNEVFTKFWHAVSPEEFAQKLKTLGSVLFYLKKCVASVLFSHQRTLKRECLREAAAVEMSVSVVECSVEEQLSAKFSEAQLWELIASLLKDERERAAMENYILEKKASQIQTHYSHLFTNVKAVYRTKENLLKRFRRNPQLQSYLPAGGGKQAI